MNSKIKFLILIFCLIFTTSCKKGSQITIRSQKETATSTPTSTPAPSPSASPEPVPLVTEDEDNNVNEHVFDVQLMSQLENMPELDVLFVIENNASMWPYQQRLGSRFGDLAFDDDVDWQMAFINTDSFETVRQVFCNSDDDNLSSHCDQLDTLSTDGYDGSFYNLEFQQGSSVGELVYNDEKFQILSPSLPLPNLDSSLLSNLFLNTMNRMAEGGLGKGPGSGEETPLANIIKALELNENQSFFRNDSTLAVIILTNTGGKIKAVDEVLTAVENKFGEDKEFVTYAIVPNENLCANGIFPYIDPQTGENKNEVCDASYIPTIQELVSKTGGITGDLDAETYAPVLQDINNNIEKNLDIQNEFVLEHTNVVEESIVLSFDPEEGRVDDWNYNAESNRIIFSSFPSVDNVVTISYEYTQ